jgi:hypothetical protein
MDITPKIIFCPELFHDVKELLFGYIGALGDATAEKKAFNIVLVIKLEECLSELIGFKACPLTLYFAIVCAVFAIALALIAHQDLEKRNTSAIRSKRMADPGASKVAYPSSSLSRASDSSLAT